MTSPTTPTQFNYAAHDLGGPYSHYTWTDHDNNGQTDNGEITKRDRVVDVAEHQERLSDIQSHAQSLSDSYLFFEPSQAMPEARIYQRQDNTDLQIEPNNVATTDELYEHFARYLEVPAHSCQEGEIAALFQTDLEALGFTVWYDDANTRVSCAGDFTGAESIPAEVGNLIGHLPGESHLPSWHLSIHLDGTEPQTGPIGHIRLGDQVESLGKSILRADDSAGKVIILKLVEYLQANNIPHGDIYVSGLIAEEVGAFGAGDIAEHHPEFLKGDIGLVFDGHKSTQVNIGASDIYLFDLRVEGEGHHVAHPELGINAQYVGSQIFNSAWGIDHRSFYHGSESTVVVANSSQTGTSSIDEEGEESIQHFNAVPDTAVYKGQIRTNEPQSASTIIERMQSEVEALCQDQGANCQFDAQLALPGYQDPDMPILPLVSAGYQRADLNAPSFVMSHGGSNVNFTFGPHGGNMVLMPIGGDHFHTTEETLDLADMRKILSASIGMFIEASQYQEVSP